jgi:HSP20 family protein
MKQDLIHLMQSLFWPAAKGFREPGWQPAADVYRTRQGWLVKLDLAGVKREDIVLGVHGTSLIVEGSRRDLCLEEGCSHHLLEISYSRFRRCIELPCDLETAGLASDYRDGMLLVYIQTGPKRGQDS